MTGQLDVLRVLFPADEGRGTQGAPALREQAFKGCYAGLVRRSLPTARESHMLAVIENAGGKKLAEQYRALSACIDAAGIALPRFTDAEFSGASRGRGLPTRCSVGKMRQAGDVCRPYLK